MSQLAALRLQYPRFDEEEFRSAVKTLESTTYDLRAKQADAPWTTHCVSAVRYAVERATGASLPRFFIGDLANGLVSYGIFNARFVPLEDQDRWDLLFFIRRSIGYGAFMITHVGIFTDDDGNYFHSTNGGWRIENVSPHLNDGTIATCSQLSRFTDPRSEYGKRYGRISWI